MWTRRTATSALAMVLAACATSSTPSSEPAPTSTASRSTIRNQTVITTSELSDPTLAGVNALDAVRRLRPSFLLTRGVVSGQNPRAGNVQVSVDGGSLAAVTTLSSMRVEEIAEIRYLNATDAAQQFGTSSASGPVILVKRR